MQNAKCRMQNYYVDNCRQQTKVQLPTMLFLSEDLTVRDIFCILHSAFCISLYSPMDCMTLFRAVFIGSLSGSLEEGVPSQSHSYTASS